MNRSAKRQQQSRESRPRRQDYQPLHSYDYSQFEIHNDTENETNGNSLQLLSKEPEKFVEKAVEPGDTLFSISLQFNCPVAEVKRLNHIVRDNEIFARRIIKVPVKPGSAVCEKLARVHSNGGLSNKSDESASASAVSLTDGPDKEKASSSNSSIKDSPKPVPYFGTLNLKPINILKSEGLLLSTEERLVDIDDDNEISSRPLLERGAIEVVSSEDDIFKCNGADWGLSWVQLIICTLLFGCTGLILYVLYIVENDAHDNVTITTTPAITTSTTSEQVKLGNQH